MIEWTKDSNGWYSGRVQGALVATLRKRRKGWLLVWEQRAEGTYGPRRVHTLQEGKEHASKRLAG